jgi:hypothetical protein
MVHASVIFECIDGETRTPTQDRKDERTPSASPEIWRICRSTGPLNTARAALLRYSANSRASIILNSFRIDLPRSLQNARAGADFNAVAMALTEIIPALLEKSARLRRPKF